MIRPARIWKASEIVFRNFPEGEETWWVRWFDHQPRLSGKSNSSLVRVVLGLLAPGPISEEKWPTLTGVLTSRDDRMLVVNLPAGYLPLLHIGAVVCGGRIVGELAANVQRMVFDSSRYVEAVQDLAPDGPEIPVSLRRMRGLPPPPRKLLQKDYALPDQRRGRMLVLASKHGGGEDLALPCPELFRIMYAPHRMLAMALLGGPWSVQADDVLDIDSKRTFSTINDHGLPVWQVATRAGFGSTHLRVAGNLFLGDRGKRAAASIWTSLAAEKEAGAISAAIPFEWDRLELDVAFIRVAAQGQSAHFTFGYRILHVAWPPHPQGPPPVISWLPPRARPKQPAGEDGSPKPRHGGPMQIPDPNAEKLEDDGSEEASKWAGANIQGLGSGWTGGGEIHFLDPGPREVSGPERPRASVTKTPEVSGGAGTGDGSAAPAGSAQALDQFGVGSAACPRFEEVVSLLNTLEAGGMIEGHGSIAPPVGKAARRMQRPVWPLPEQPIIGKKGKERWYLRDVATKLKPEVRRTAMVRAVHVDGRIAYWLELEPRHDGKTLRSLVFSLIDQSNSNSAILALLEYAAQHRGVWPSADLLVAGMDVAPFGCLIGNAAVYWHEYSKTFGKDGLRTLAPNRALTTIRSVFGSLG